MPNPDRPHAANPAAVGNVGAVLAAHLMAHLLKTDRLTVEDVQAIFRDTRKRYTSTPEGQVPADDWERQTTATLELLRGDVLYFGQRHV